MAHTDRHTYQLRPGDVIHVHRDHATGRVWPAIAAGHAEHATVLDPPILVADLPWVDDVRLVGVLNTSAGPCRVDLAFRWLVPEPAATRLRLLRSQVPA